MSDANFWEPLDPDERRAGAAAHASVVIPFLGALVPIYIWITSREKSKGLAFQAAQAAVFQASIILVWVLAGLCCIGTNFATILALPAAINQNGVTEGFTLAALAVPVLIIAAAAVIGAAFLAYGITGAVFTCRGRPFHYAVAGKVAGRLLSSMPAAPVKPPEETSCPPRP